MVEQLENDENLAKDVKRKCTFVFVCGCVRVYAVDTRSNLVQVSYSNNIISVWTNGML